MFDLYTHLAVKSKFRFSAQILPTTVWRVIHHNNISSSLHGLDGRGILVGGLHIVLSYHSVSQSIQRAFNSDLTIQNVTREIKKEIYIILCQSRPPHSQRKKVEVLSHTSACTPPHLHTSFMIYIHNVQFQI